MVSVRDPRGLVRAAVCALAAISLSGCGPDEPEAQTAPVLSSNTAIAAATPGADDYFAQNADFPVIGKPYAQARAILLAQGLVPAPDAVEDPHPEFPELSRTNHEALLLDPGDTHQGHYTGGAARYVIIWTDGLGRVSRANYAKPIEGHAPIPPKTAADIPDLTGRAYADARRRLLALGYRSRLARALSGDAHDGRLDEMPREIGDCAGSGAAYCDAWWLAPDGRTLRIVTIGEPQPGKVYAMSWAGAEDFESLPPDWPR